ncbi:VWA domain-containing protein [Streptomyces sp. NPDC001780]
MGIRSLLRKVFGRDRAEEHRESGASSAGASAATPAGKSAGESAGTPGGASTAASVPAQDGGDGEGKALAPEPAATAGKTETKTETKTGKTESAAGTVTGTTAGTVTGTTAGTTGPSEADAATSASTSTGSTAPTGSTASEASGTSEKTEGKPESTRASVLPPARRSPEPAGAADLVAAAFDRARPSGEAGRTVPSQATPEDRTADEPQPPAAKATVPAQASARSRSTSAVEKPVEDELTSSPRNDPQAEADPVVPAEGTADGGQEPGADALNATGDAKAGTGVEPRTESEAPAGPEAVTGATAEPAEPAEPTEPAEPVEPAAASGTAATVPEQRAESTAAPAGVPEPKADTTAEPRAETATVAAAPEPEAAFEPEPTTTAAATERTDAIATTEPTDTPDTVNVGSAGNAGKPAFSLARLKTRAPELAEHYKAAGAALRKRGLGGARATVYLVLDRSASMRPFYKDGSVQHLGERALALAAHLDAGATVHLVFFSTEIDGTGELELTEYEGKINELHDSLGRMGRTNYHLAVDEVVALHEKAGRPGPALVIFQTDGAPSAVRVTEQALARAAGAPMFWQFVAFGDPDAKDFNFVRRLGADPNAPHVGFSHAGPAPRALGDAEFYRDLLAAWQPDGTAPTSAE